MLITPLWHTQFIIDIKNKNDENVKIMVDSWMSDYVLWDLMERTVKIIPDWEKIKNLDAIYISHSHTDHFDPYSLQKIYTKNNWKNPLLILPFTLEYLVPLLEEFLEDVEIKILFPWENFVLNWVNIKGYLFEQSQITNEDDVMMLSVSNEDEIIFAEIDTLPEDDNFEVQKKLYEIFTRKKYKTVFYLASRNELEGQIPLFDKPENKRKSFQAKYISERKESIEYFYEKFEYEDFEDFPNILKIPNFCRGFIGQWITYPFLLSENLWNSAIFPLDEIASIENNYAKKYWYNFSQKALNAGRQYKIENWQIETWRKDCPIWKLVLNNEKNPFSLWERIFSKTPLLADFPLEKSENEYKKIILDILNNRFLPYWSASPVASFRDWLLKNNWKYSIIFLDNDKKEKFAFEFSLAWQKFLEKNISEIKNADEVYFLRDFIDFIEWRQELYSNFWHELDKKKIYRLWTCLWANFMNHDLILEKYRFHFKRAKNGENINSYVEPILENMKK